MSGSIYGLTSMFGVRALYLGGMPPFFGVSCSADSARRYFARSAQPTLARVASLQQAAGP